MTDNEGCKRAGDEVGIKVPNDSLFNMFDMFETVVWTAAIAAKTCIVADRLQHGNRLPVRVRCQRGNTQPIAALDRHHLARTGPEADHVAAEESHDHIARLWRVADGTDAPHRKANPRRRPRRGSRSGLLEGGA